MDSNCRSPVAKEVNPFREWEPSWSDKVRLEAVAYLPGTDSSNPSPSSAESANFRSLSGDSADVEYRIQQNGDLLWCNCHRPGCTIGARLTAITVSMCPGETV